MNLFSKGSTDYKNFAIKKNKQRKFGDLEINNYLVEVLLCFSQNLDYTHTWHDFLLHNIIYITK